MNQGKSLNERVSNDQYCTTSSTGSLSPPKPTTTASWPLSKREACLTLPNLSNEFFGSGWVKHEANGFINMCNVSLDDEEIPPVSYQIMHFWRMTKTWKGVMSIWNCLKVLRQWSSSGTLSSRVCSDGAVWNYWCDNVVPNNQTEDDDRQTGLVVLEGRKNKMNHIVGTQEQNGGCS